MNKTAIDNQTAVGRQRMEAVWRARAIRLALRPVLGRTGQSALPVIVLEIGEERFGIDLPDVAEVLPPVRATPVPGAAPVFSGVINVHGEIRPVIDLGRLLQIETARNGDRLPRVILLRRDGRELGLEIDSVEQIRWIGPGDMQSAGFSPHTTSPHLKGLTKDLLMLLSTEALFAELTQELQLETDYRPKDSFRLRPGDAVHGPDRDCRVPKHATPDRSQ